jgi:hypothetical protein
MSDLDFSHNVSEIPAGQSLPEPYKGREKVSITQFPDMTDAINDYAATSNWMSRIGSYVAGKASDAIAQKVGGELGKNPQGDIGVPLTDFDKTMQESYETQAQATLGLQANKLINDSALDAAKADRITPDIIKKTNDSIAIGLKNILKNAPSQVSPKLQYQYGTHAMSLTSDLTNRMINEQHEDRRNNTALASQTNAENAYSFGLKGNDKAAESAIETTRRLSAADVASRLLTPEQAKTNVDTARKSYLSGKMIHEYENARAAGKGEAYLKSIADKKPSYLSDTDYMSVTQNLSQYVGHQDALRNQDQQLRLADFNTSIAMNPMAPDMPQQLQQLKNNVSAEAYQKAQLGYIEAVKKFNKENADTNLAMASWNSPDAFARVPDKAKNKSFDMMSSRYVQQRQQQGNPITQEDAEVQVAAAAGGKIPAFVASLKNRINSGNPEMMETAAKQMDSLYSMNASHALEGLDDKDKSIFTQYKSLRDALPPEEAAKVAIQNANQDPDTQKMNKEKWSAFVKTQTGGFAGFGSKPPQKWAMQQVGLNPDDFMNPGIANEYGNMILQKYGSLYQNMNGDQTNALKLTKQEVDSAFGDTGVNGGKVKTLHPIEKVLGFESNSDVVPFIQQDVTNVLNKSFIPLKDAYGKKQSNVYWDIVPSDMKNHALVYGHDYAPIQVKRYTKTSSGVKADTYNVMLIGNSFNWDIALQTEAGIRPLIQMAPYIGVQTYTPNKKAITDAYAKRGKA